MFFDLTKETPYLQGQNTNSFQTTRERIIFSLQNLISEHSELNVTAKIVRDGEVCTFINNDKKAFLEIIRVLKESSVNVDRASLKFHTKRNASLTLIVRSE